MNAEQRLLADDTKVVCGNARGYVASVEPGPR
jgi:hypothetical protein